MLERQYIPVKSNLTSSENMYFYDNVFFEAHKGVHQDKYMTIHRYYYTSDGKYFIKECVEKGD
jgi:hypothetical protein